jgi:predicted dehydrogenase
VTDDAHRPGWGILATGGIAAAFTADLRTAGLRVAAVGSRTEASARAFADAHGIPNAHGSWEALAADPSVDVIYIATPHPAHAAAATVALEHGKHVLIEKPFTLNAAEAEQVLALAEERGLIALEAMWTRWLPHMLEIRGLLQSGAIGEPQALLVDHTQALPTDPKHRINDPALGGGALLDLGVYPLSYAVDLFGAPVGREVAATFTGTGVDQRVSGVLVHDGGAHTVFSTALNLAGPNTAVILGTAGSIAIEPTWYTPTGYTVFDQERKIVTTSRPQVDGRGMQLQALELERLIREGLTESERMPHAQTLDVLRLMDGVRADIGLVYPQEAAGEPATAAARP